MTGLKRLAEQLNIAEYVDFCGRLSRKEIVEMYASASLYLHGGVEEPFGMVLIEALASGCPVLAHASGGPLEIVTPGTGRLMNTLNPEIWSEAALALLKQVD